MRKTISFFDEPTDFSLVQGGPLFQLFLRGRLLRPPTDLLIRRIVVIVLVAWLPPLLLSILSGKAVGGHGVPFLYDLGAQARLLLGLPLFLAAEVAVHRRLKLTVRQFLERGIVAPEDQPRFESFIASGMRLRNSAVAEVLLLLFAVVAGYWLGKRYIVMQASMWYVAPIDGHAQITAAGYWYLFVSLTIFRFLQLRWYLRIFVWYRLLWQVSRHIRLGLNALHSDRAGGIGFLSDNLLAFAPILLAHTVALAGTFGTKIWHEGAKLPQFEMEIIVWMVFLMLLVLVPLCFFVTQLADAQRTGLREYGLVASRYVAEFRRKWIEGHAAKDDSLVGTADIQSLADLSNSFEVVQEMRIVPVRGAVVLRLALLTALPFLPLVLTMIPLDQLINRSIAAFF
jgi:hypothetical protein